MNRRQTTAQATTTAHLEAQKRAKFEQRKKETKQQAMRLAVAEKGEVVPTLSELPDQSLNSPSKFPSTAFYDTISTYPVGHGMNTSAYKAILLGAKPENQITCKCKHDCVTIPNCPCRRMAVWMNHGDCESLLVSGHEIDFSQGVHENKFYFSCSSGCKCTGCSLNSVLEAKKDHNEKVKVTRRRLDVGFGVEAKRHIEKGEFIATFVGTLCGPLTANGLKAETINVRYSYTATNKNSIKQVTKLLKSKEYVRYLREAYHSDIIIDPLERGNFTRFFNHSCQPNLTIVKVCAGGVSPLDLNMVFVANRAINQGEEMTFDYGPHYLMGQCLCEICKNKEDVDMATAENINGGSESENICPNTPNRLGKRPSGVKKPQIPKKSKKNGLMTLPTIVTGETLPLFSRLKDFGKNLLCNFPGTAFFTSIVVNVLGAYLSKAVTEAIKLGNQNPIP
ncbi:hypothetical protein L3Y34_012043 [Caenorhabditis briggsae]|uniref:SET domain-containing protein n=1 Tax=Caenorhabditis briggsae TaxID=6238 RepID=A0AAE9CW38_CAEBR|nr:hypothetical protein L3Y34_012043 [Caenorhabditis briggsae]